MTVARGTPLPLAGLLALLLAAACSAASAPASPTSQPSPRPSPAITPTPPQAPAPSPTPATDPSPAPGLPAGAQVVITLGEGSRARYRVREQLAAVNFPSDAVGETSAISGVIALDASGAVLSESSKVTLDLRTLRSDSDRRDQFLRTRSLESDTYPVAEFVVREVRGLPWPLPSEGQATLQLVGDMTLHGVTSPLTWEATAQFSNSTVTGQATTRFQFGQFQMDLPRAFLVVSVEDDIRLEVDFQASITRLRQPAA